MEDFGAFCNGDLDWEVLNLSKLFWDEELELTQQILHQFSIPIDKDQDLSFIKAFRFSPISGSFNGDICLHSSLHNSSQESSPCSNSGTGSFSMPALNNEIVPVNSDHFGIPVADDLEISMDFKDEHALTSTFLVDQVPVFENVNLVQPAELHLKRKIEVPDDLKMETCAPGNPKKKSRTSKYGHGKVTKKGKEDENGSDGQSYSSSSSEEEDASRETHGGSSSGLKSSRALNLTAKTRAGRGSASDPQSLYAKKRRERINERLRILQNLVPNGTKVDISTMLDEAVHYVKFLQLQIKLLSSDDLWMYAPLVYNGIDIGLNPKLSALL